MSVRLVNSSEEIIINKPVFRIGQEKCYVDYFLNHSSVSRNHCNIVSRDGQYFLVDINSTNYTYINGKRISPGPEHLLRNGDRVGIANLEFRFENPLDVTENLSHSHDPSHDHKYQVFISFRNVDRDAALAEKLFNTLKQKGIRAFFSKYSIDEAARTDYVNVIDEALDCALLLVAVGTSKENLTSKWVKSEINQFRTLMNSDDSGKRSIASLRSKDFPERALPSGIKSYQSFTDLDTLVRFIEVFLGNDSTFQKDEEITSLLGISFHKNFQAFEEPRDQECVAVGDVIDGKYRVLSVIGKGGMSVVYKAINDQTGYQYAVKVIRRDKQRGNAFLINNFREEANLMMHLHHKAIPQIYDVIDSQDSLILVMDFINGISLQQLLNQSGAMQEDAVLDYARQICTVLDYLHMQDRPVIYRDLKPANVIVLPNGEIKLIDFGTARYYSQRQLEDTTCLGTIGYAAPEQFGGMGQTDARTDIYTLGVTLYHLVTGCNPAEPPYEIQPIRRINAHLSRGLEAVILKCTQRDPDQRFQSVKELLDALDHMKQFALREVWKKVMTPKSHRVAVPKPKAPEKDTPTLTQFKIPGTVEGIFETTVLHADPGIFETSVPPVIRPAGAGDLSNSKARAALDLSIQKLKALDPDSQRVIQELIDKLSK